MLVHAALRRSLVVLALLAVAACRFQDGPLGPTAPGVSLQSLTIRCGAPAKTVACEALAHYDDGSVQSVTAHAAWSSSDGTIAGIIRGIVTFTRGGTIDVAASYQGVTARTQISVMPAR